MYRARGTSNDHAPLTCMVFDPMVHPQFGDFYVAADYQFCPLAGFSPTQSPNGKMSQDGTLFL